MDNGATTGRSSNWNMTIRTSITLTLISVLPGTHEVIVQCRGMVETEDNAGVIGWHAGHLPLWAFLAQTDRDPSGRADARLIVFAQAQ